jgi:hypothetical protein
MSNQLCPSKHTNCLETAPSLFQSKSSRLNLEHIPRNAYSNRDSNVNECLLVETKADKPSGKEQVETEATKFGKGLRNYNKS